MSAYLAADGRAASTLGDRLMSAAPRESGVFASLRTVTRGGRTRLVLGEPIHSGVAWAQQSVQALQPTGAMISAAVSAAHARRSGLAFIHTHPLGNEAPALSSIDIQTTRRLGAAFTELVDGPFASLVVTPSGWAGVQYADGRVTPLDRIFLAGRRLQLYGHQPYREDEALDDRQQRALGQSGNAALRQLRVAVVGVGGLGGPLAETLARMGVGCLTLVDGDTLEISNVRRVFAVTRQDAEQRRSKVAAVAAGIERLGLGGSVRAICGDVRDPDVQEHLIDCDVLFSATDTHSSRAAMAELAVRGCYALIDLGVRVGIRGPGELDSLLFERRIQIPGGPCLWCWRRLDARQIRVEFMSDFERESLIADGYVTGIAGGPEPSVAALTVTAAGAGAAGLLGLLSAGFDRAPLGSSFELLRSEAYALDRDDPDPDCICARWRT